MNVAVLLLAIAIGDAAVLERNSPGLVPSMHSNYINAYAPDLAFAGTIALFPLLNSPSAITFSPTGDLFVAEACDPSPCRQIRRYGPSGFPTPFGDPIHDWAKSMEILPSGDMIVLLSGVLGRLDADGRWIESTPLPIATLFNGFDVDRDQCTIAYAALDKIGLVNICSGAEPVTLSTAGNFFDVRFLPNGNLLLASRGVVYEIDRRGMLLRSFTTSESDYGLLAIDPDGMSFRTTAGNRLFRFDLITGNQIAQPVQLRNAAYGAVSMAIRGEWRAAWNPAPHRRSVLH